MIPYIFTFVFPALLALLQPVDKPWKSLRIWIPVAILYILFIGFRHEVGSDWDNYMNMFTFEAVNMSYAQAFVHDDPAYWLLQVWAHDIGKTIHIVNFVGGILFVTGLIIFIRRLPNPWLALVVAMAYTILAVGMGYERQGIALGITLWAITALIDKKFLKFFILILFAAAFHKSAVLMLGLGLFHGGKGKYLKAVAAIVMGVGIYAAFMSGHEERLVSTYIDSDMQSSGAYIRVFMNAIPAFFFFYFHKKWKRLWPNSYTIWLLIAWGSLFAIVGVIFLSTAVDRVSLYFIPLQFVVFSSLPILLRGKMNPKVTTALVIAYYALVYFVWLLFAKWAFAWVPYQNILPTWIEYWL